MRKIISALTIALCIPAAWADTFTAKVVGVTDGDTITVLTEQSCNSGKTCKNGKVEYKVRLAEIDTPEKKQPYGAKAKRALSDLVFGKIVSVDKQGIDQYRRLIAHIYLDGKWINAELVKSGHAWVYRKYSKSPALLSYETEARQLHIGLWSLPESELTPPWEWRRNK